MIKTIEILTKKIETDKSTFTGYKAVQKNGKLIDCKFRRELVNVPDYSTSRFFVDVETGDCNIDKTRKFPVLWISKVIEIKESKKSSADDSVIAEMF